MFQKISGPKIFMEKRGERGGEGGSITIFRRKFFCLTVPKNSVEVPFCDSENFW